CPSEIGGFASVEADLRGRPSAPSRTGRLLAPPEDSRRRSSERAVAALEPPSRQLRTFRQRTGFYEIDYPENWRTYPASRGYGVVISAEGDLDSTDGPKNIVRGVVVNHYEPFDARGDGTLEDATDDLIDQIRRGSPYLRERPGSERSETIDEAPARSVVLSGASPETGEEERVTVFTRELTDGHVLYALLIA